MFWITDSRNNIRGQRFETLAELVHFAKNQIGWDCLGYHANDADYEVPLTEVMEAVDENPGIESLNCF